MRVSSDGVRVRTDGAMVGPYPTGGSETPWSQASAWESWSGGRGTKRLGLLLRLPLQALWGPGPVYVREEAVGPRRLGWLGEAIPGIGGGGWSLTPLVLRAFDGVPEVCSGVRGPGPVCKYKRP